MTLVHHKDPNNWKIIIIYLLSLAWQIYPYPPHTHTHAQIYPYPPHTHTHKSTLILHTHTHKSLPLTQFLIFFWSTFIVSTFYSCWKILVSGINVALSLFTPSLWIIRLLLWDWQTHGCHQFPCVVLLRFVEPSSKLPLSL